VPPTTPPEGPGTTIDPKDTPKTPNPNVEGEPETIPNADSWSLFDLICTIATVLAIIVCAIVYIVRRRDDRIEDYKVTEYRKRPIWLILSLAAAIVSVVLFILTQDMSLTMKIFDEWSIAFAVIAIIGIIAARLTFSKKSEDATA
jgi:amino acid transporter